MRDTGDTMEDAFSEDTMMECNGEDAGLDDLVDLADDISHSAPTIRDAAERLLTLLGVEDNDDDVLSSSEDEGVELDGYSDENDDEDDDDDNEPQNTRLLHQLAASLAQELKYSQKQGNKQITRSPTLQRGSKITQETTRGYKDDQVQRMEVAHDIFHQDEKSVKYGHQAHDQTLQYKTGLSRGFFDTSGFESNASLSTSKYRTETRFRTIAHDEEKTVLPVSSSGITDSWAIGWDACAAEAIRYLVEDEGLSPLHPTVIAMKSHLESQRERASIQYAM